MEINNAITIIFSGIAIVLAILALLLAFNYQLVKMIVDTLVQRELNKVEAKFYSILDYNKALDIWNTDLDTAIALTDRAIQRNVLDGESLIMAKSNLAYYLAKGHYPRARDKALQLAEETLDKAYIYPNSTNTLKINYGYVIMRYSKTTTDKQNAIDFLKGIKDRRTITENILYERTSNLPLRQHQIVEIDSYIKEAEGLTF